MLISLVDEISRLAPLKRNVTLCMGASGKVSWGQDSNLQKCNGSWKERDCIEKANEGSKTQGKCFSGLTHQGRGTFHPEVAQGLSSCVHMTLSCRNGPYWIEEVIEFWTTIPESHFTGQRVTEFGVPAMRFREVTTWSCKGEACFDERAQKVGDSKTIGYLLR